MNSFKMSTTKIKVPKENDKSQSKDFEAVDHILSQQNHIGVMGIGRKDSDSGFGGSFYSCLRKDFDMLDEFIEIYVDVGNPWVLFSRKTASSSVLYSADQNKNGNKRREMVDFPL